jgi:lipid-binding SYLF domain-containing protein
MSTLRKQLLAALFAATALTGATTAVAQESSSGAAPPHPPALSPAEKEAERKARLQLATDGLEKLYKLQPEAKASVEKAVGYAVFDITSIYAVFLVGQKGKGVLFDNATHKPTFMLSTRAGTGPGVGKQRVYQIFTFKTKQALEQFVLAGSAGGDIGASASTGTGGIVRSFNPSIEIYQVPESGMAVQASWGGTVYTVDTQLK